MGERPAFVRNLLLRFLEVGEGIEAPSEEELQTALMKSHVMNLFRRLPAGLETKLTELGLRIIWRTNLQRVFLLHGRYCRKRMFWLLERASVLVWIKETAQAVCRGL